VSFELVLCFMGIMFDRYNVTTLLNMVHNNACNGLCLGLIYYQ